MLINDRGSSLAHAVGRALTRLSATGPNVLPAGAAVAVSASAYRDAKLFRSCMDNNRWYTRRGLHEGR